MHVIPGEWIISPSQFPGMVFLHDLQGISSRVDSMGDAVAPLDYGMIAREYSALQLRDL